jgi:acetolactate synthase-1/2/3 large subunit
MGISLPGAIAASLIDPDRQVVAAMGDGGFLMNSQELETAKRLGVTFTTLVFNDNDYGLISWKQQMSRGRSTGTAIDNPDIKAYAESFGIKGYSPTTLNELKSQLELTISSKELSVMEIKVDSSVNKKLLEKLNSYWKDDQHVEGH